MSDEARVVPALIVAVGASAGGLPPLERLFRACPADAGIAFVVIQHLSPDHESSLPEFLQRHTTMRVYAAGETRPLEPNAVYVIPPGRFLDLNDGMLTSVPVPDGRASLCPIDHFLRVLAEDRRERAACIILSGAGNDGRSGLRAIKAHGGLVLVQDPDDAEYTSMPASAIATGLVDCTVKPDEMPAILMDYLHHSQINCEPDRRFDADDIDHLGEIIGIIRARTGRDFRNYKQGTLVRRIQRRLGLRRITNLPDYVKVLRDNPDETAILVRDLLIKVTSFFRDPEVWRGVQENVLTPLLTSREADQPLRIWVPACATGEEAYTIAILALETAASLQCSAPVQLFATDVDQEALAVAREGRYPASVAGDLSSERLERFFLSDGATYRVRDSLRESVVFAPQDIVNDPPFSKMDFISCRNLLIYLEPDAQHKVISLCHFALNRDAHLLLGTAETVGQDDSLFEPVSKILRLYRKTGHGRRSSVVFPMGTSLRAKAPEARTSNASDEPFARLTREALLRHLAPAAVLVSKTFRVLYFYGNARDYVAQPEGEPTHDLVAIARPGICVKLRGVLHKAVRDKVPATVTGAQLARGSGLTAVTIRVFPVDGGTGDELYLVVFDESRAVEGTEAETLEPRDIDEGAIARQLEAELRLTREQLHNTIEQLEASNEELQSSHEEAMSMNEELQSANEELETSKEELQSLNEELYTVNAQLQEKVGELESLNNDLHNLLTSSNVATVFLDTDLRIKRYTPASTQLIHLRESDLGRPLDDLKTRFRDPDLFDDASAVLDSLVPVMREVRTEDGIWLIRRILPYRTQDNRIEGVVLTLVDITERRAMEDRIRASEYQLRLMANALPALISFVDAEGRYQFNNDRYAKWFGIPKTEFKGRHMRDVVGDAMYKSIEPYVDRALAGEDVSFETSAVDCDGNEHFVRASYIPQRDENGRVLGFFVLVSDLTERRAMEEELRLSEERYRSLVAATTSIVWVANARGEFTTRQPSWEEYTGQAFEDYLANGWIQAIHPDDRARLTAEWDRVAEQGQPFSFEGQVWSVAHRGYRHFGMRAAAIRDGSGTIREWVGTITDIHERRNHELIDARLAAIVESSNDAIIGKTLDGIITSWNAGAERIYGYRAGDMIGWPIGTIIPDEFASELPGIMERLRRGERIEQLETERLRSDGSRATVSLTISPVRDASGNIVSASAIGRDVTERIRYEQALRENEERLRLAVTASNTGTFLLDVETEHMRWDDNLYRLFGLDDSQLVQRMSEFIALIHPEDRITVSSAFDASRKDGRDFELEFRALLPDGAVRWILIKGKTFMGDQGQATTMAGACVDITRRKRAETALEESEARFRGTFEEAAVGIAHVDRTGRWLRMNQRMCDILGYTRRELSQKTFRELSHPDDVEDDWRQFAALMSGAISNYVLEKRYARKDGDYVWVLVSSSLQRDDEGRPTYAIRVVEDVSARKEAERVLQEVNENLERRVAERTESLVHYQQQLRALATELTFTAETERRRLATELHDFLAQQLVVCQLKLSQIKRYAKSAETDILVRELDELLTASLRYTRSLIAELSPSVLYDAGLVPALRWLGEQMKQHGLNVHVDAKCEIGTIPVDQAILAFQSAREFLFNVVKHADTDQAWITVDIRDGHLVVKVRDEGKGFDLSEQQINTTNTGRFGLFSVRERLEAMGGELHVRSGLRDGTECALWLPLHQLSTAREKERGSASSTRK